MFSKKSDYNFAMASIKIGKLQTDSIPVLRFQHTSEPERIQNFISKQDPEQSRIFCFKSRAENSSQYF